MPEKFEVRIGSGETRVTALLYPAARENSVSRTIILGHGAGAGQTSGFMVTFANGLAQRGLDAVTFNFPYTEAGRRIPDTGLRLEACYRAVITAVIEHPSLAGNRLIIGGKSMGGRIASQVAAAGVEGVSGLVFLGYPLHPPAKPEQLRDKHLPDIKVPMLFVQGERDAFGTPEELSPILKRADKLATLFVIEEGDHSFKAPKRTGLTQPEIYTRIMDHIVDWSNGI